MHVEASGAIAVLSSSLPIEGSVGTEYLKTTLQAGGFSGVWRGRRFAIQGPA